MCTLCCSGRSILNQTRLLDSSSSYPIYFGPCVSYLVSAYRGQLSYALQIDVIKSVCTYIKYHIPPSGII